MDFHQISKITITCPARLSDTVAKEVQTLGYEVSDQFITGVELSGNMIDCIRLNMNLRTGSQVLFSLKSFTARNPQDLYDEVKSIDWSSILLSDKTLTISSVVDNPTVNNSMFASLRVKDAIVDYMREKTGERPNTSASPDEASLHLFWRGSFAELFIDTSGQTLSKHGYRLLPGSAPMIESLAAAIILNTRWDHHTPFINPMCGSGTIAIEAALIASNIPPSEFRDNYAFMHIQGYDSKMYKDEVKRINHQIIDNPSVKIIASDHDARAIETSKLNAEKAGVAHLIEFYLCDYMDTPVPQEQAGVVVLNPEYGERLGEESELITTYKGIGDFFKKHCASYWGYVFTGNIELGKMIGLKPKSKKDFYNGKIPCKLLEFELYDGTRRNFN